MEKWIKTLIVAVMILSTLLPPISYVQPVESMQTMSSNDLSIVAQLQRKDTKMLCLDGCSLTGSHAWDAIHPNKGCDHDYHYCGRACVSMIASYYGGRLSQDSLVLSHRGVPVAPWLSWALKGAEITYFEGKPLYDQIREWIDSDRPILRVHVWPGGHATVIDGYSYGRVHVIDPLSGTETSISYDTIDIEYVLVPPTNATARSDEETIWMDSDEDGVIDYDEEVRFGTSPYNSDSDGDSIDDKTEIRSYTFLADGSFDSDDVRRSDADNDGKEAQRDWDSDNGGCPDGMEDLNLNGKIDIGETDPFDPNDDPPVKYPVAVFTHQPEIVWINKIVTLNATQSSSHYGNITGYAWRFTRLVNITLFHSTSKGWGFAANNLTSPGPTIIVEQGVIVNLILTGEDDNAHNFFIDYNGDGFSGKDDPQSRIFWNETISFQFNATIPGTFTYYSKFRYSAYPENNRLGTLVVQPTNTILLPQEAIIHHTTSKEGRYSVTLSVIDEKGFHNSTQKMIFVTFRADLNKDKIVNIIDLSIVAYSFGTKEGDEYYNQIADMDSDNEINVIDLSIVAMDYGKTV